MRGEILHIVDERGVFDRFELVVEGMDSTKPVTMVITSDEVEYLEHIPKERRIKELLDWRRYVLEETS